MCTIPVQLVLAQSMTPQLLYSNGVVLFYLTRQYSCIKSERKVIQLALSAGKLINLKKSVVDLTALNEKVFWEMCRKIVGKII